MFLLGWLVLAACVAAQAAAELTACPERCMCETSGIMRCNNNGSWLSLSSESSGPEPYLTINCEDGVFNYTSDMPNTTLFNNNPSLIVQFQNCPLPDGPLVTVTRLFGDSTIHKLILKSFTGKLQTKHFRGMEHTLRHLRLGNMGNTTVPAVLFGVLPLLKSFSVVHSQLAVKPDDFVNATGLRSLEIMFCNVTELPPNLFKSLKQLVILNYVGNQVKTIDTQFQDLGLLKYLDLSTNQIRQISVHAFKGTDNLERISLFENELEEIPTGLFKGLKMLEEITIHKNKNKFQIGAGAFADLPALKDLHLEACNITHLPNDTFRNSSALEHLFLQKNELEELPQDLFKGLENLNTLDLSHNKIRTIQPGHFASLRRVERLKLDFNRIVELVSNVFSGLSEVRELSLSNNSISLVDKQAFYGCHELTTLRLANNALSMSWKIELDPDVSPLSLLLSLRHLDLSGNRIPRLYRDWLLTMLKLETLDLSRNQISMLTDADLEFLQSNNITVDLENNNITFIYLQPDRKPRLFGHILLSHNPLRCDCNIYNFLRIIDTPIFEITHLKCNAPDALKGVYVKDISVQNLTCPVARCPHVCACVVRPATSSLQLECSSQPGRDDFAIPDLRAQGYPKTQLKINHTITKLHKLPNHINELILSNISLTELPAGNYSVSSIDISHNQISSVKNLFTVNNYTAYRLADNHLICDCDHKDDVIALQRNYKRVLDYKQLQCGQELVLRVDGQRLCSTRDALVLATLVASVAFFILVFTVLYYKNQRKIKLFLFYYGLWPATAEEALDKDKKYDAFVSFAHEDEDFVVNKLLAILEHEPYNFRMCVHLRDWVPGMFIQQQIVKSVEESRRTILVLSKSFAASTWSVLEFGAALTNASSERRAKIVVIVLDDVIDQPDLNKDLKTYISQNTYVKWGDPWFWEKLVYALPKRNKSKKEKAEKGVELEKKLSDNALDARIVYGNKVRY